MLRRGTINSNVIEIEPLVCVQVGPTTWLQSEVDTAWGSTRLVAKACLVQPGHKRQALFLNQRHVKYTLRFNRGSDLRKVKTTSLVT